MTAVAPPAQGEMLLLPILPGSAAHLAADAIDRGGRIVALGPIAGSIVVSGKRDTIARGLFARGVMVIAAPDILCGTKSREAAS